MRIDQMLQELAAAGHGLVSRRDALAAGVCESALDRRIRAGSVIVEQPGIYRLAGVASTLARRERAAVLAAHPDGVLSHRSAARLHGLVVEGAAIDVTVSSTRLPRLREVMVHRSLDLQPSHVRLLDGVRVTTVERTLADLGDVVPPHRVAWALERAVIERLTTWERATSILDEIGGRGRNGRGALRAALAEWPFDGRPPDSVLEVALARLLARNDLPMPSFQHEVRHHGRFVARVDAAWLDRMIVGEVDGHHAHAGSEQFKRDLRRQNELVRLGYTVLRWSWDDVQAGWRVVRDVRSALDVPVLRASTVAQRRFSHVER
jgi:very-short-patch-repair endonuclease